jgi:hypothetical protein
VKKATLVPIEVNDAQSFVSSLVMHETKVLEVTIWSHTNKMIFNVISSPTNPIIIGLSQLTFYNPQVNLAHVKIANVLKKWSRKHQSVKPFPQHG